MKIGISSNFPEVARQIERMQKDIATQATARAVNRTMEQAKAAMSREIRSEFALPAKTVNAALRLSRATFKDGAYNVSATLESPNVRGRSMNVIHFTARQTKKGVTVRIKKSGGRRLIRDVFIANKGRTVFEREPGTRMQSRSRYNGKHAEKIVPVQTIGISQMFNTKRINQKVVAVIQDRFPRIFAREARYYTERFNRSRAR